jgi:LysR family transcriptional regulator, glycine cleavage system transcriptional activator
VDSLPPLNAVRAFEVVGRRLSVTQAAQELYVTAGAVSRQIKALEDALGVQLLVRGHRQVALTQAGEDYHRVVTKAMDMLSEASARVSGREKRTRLKVRAYTTFALKWLIPRLSSFHAANAEVEVLLTASLDPVDFRKDDIDGAIRLGDGRWPDARAFRLMPNLLVPVCSPSVATQVREPADLRDQVLLHSIARADDWSYWLASAGVDDRVDARGGMTYESSAMAYTAAVEGQGFAIAQRFLVEAELADGKLVQPFPQALDMGDFTYYLVTPAGRRESVSMRTFREWLLAQFDSGT